MTAEVAVEKTSPKWLLLVQGVALIILSILLFTTPLKMTQLLVVLLGIYWLVSGIMNLVWIFVDRSQWGWKLVIGILGIVAGLMIIQHPLWSTILTTTTLIIVMGLWGLMIGVIGLIQAFTGAGWGAGLLGVLSIIFGIILLAEPILAAIGLPYVLGAFALVGGIGALIGFFMK
jgi:uncharacterized membrane protein HdeD (DUF308 family)